MALSRTVRLALAAALALPAVAAAVPASAAPAPHTARPAYGAHHFGHGPRYDGGVWGGYVAQGSGFQSVTGSWTMPAVQCNTSSDLFAPWVGIDGYGSQTVEQTGVQADCSSGSPVYSAWYEMYPAPPQYFSDPVDAGDVFTASVVNSGGGSYTLQISDTTKGWSESTVQQLDGQNVSAEAVIESPSQSYPSFNRLDFTNVTVNGQVFDAYNPQAINSGPYTETALSNGSFAIVPA
ncbi:G1 family glutamic endopeptidase [Kitasatospora sp. NPDC101183]|uniref:G1 family glutamic endopeptidase n=1 Tax=Kitasatospora sp. NPDC101183 TaxID=3364100 RepID=UPI0037F6DA49